MFGAAAFVGPDVLVEIFFPIVVCKLFPRLNVAERPYVDPAFRAVGLAVGHAGVINVAGKVAFDIAVDDFVFAHFEIILAPVFFALSL